jgi:transposase-like protein
LDTAALAEQASSGMSVAAFASHLGVAVSTLYQWRRRLDDSRGRSGPQHFEVTRVVRTASPAGRSDGEARCGRAVSAAVFRAENFDF